MSKEKKLQDIESLVQPLLNEFKGEENKLSNDYEDPETFFSSKEVDISKEKLNTGFGKKFFLRFWLLIKIGFSGCCSKNSW